MPYARTVKNSSGAIAVQIVHSHHRRARQIEHIGSAHDDAELELLKAVTRQRLAAEQGQLDLGLDTAARGGPLPMAVSRWIEHQTGWSIRRFVRTARRYRTIQIQSKLPYVITAANPLPDDLRAASTQIKRAPGPVRTSLIKVGL